MNRERRSIYGIDKFVWKQLGNMAAQPLLDSIDLRKKVLP